MLYRAAAHLAPADDARRAVCASSFPAVEAGRLHEVLRDGEACGLGVTFGWLEPTDVRSHVWIGKRVWPGFTALHRAGLLDGSLLVDATSAAQRAWAAELCVRCSSVAAVIADGRGFDLTMTRRLQLAARGMDCRLIVLRPGGEGGLSAAGSRWRVTPVVAGSDPATGDPARRPRWSVELLRRKGGHFTDNGHTVADDRPAGLRTAGEMFNHESDAPAIGAGRPASTHRWTFEWDPAGGRGVPVGAPADVADRPAAATLGAG